jgi:hypothetical protein
MLHVAGYEVVFAYNKAEGVTTAILWPDDLDERPHMGHVALHHTDTFIKAIGRKKALAKALRGLDRGKRAEIWNGLWEKGMRCD